MSALDIAARLHEIADSHHSDHDKIRFMLRAVDALTAPPKGQAEAVAWADPHTIGLGWPYVAKTRSSAHTMPLFTSPAPAGRGVEGMEATHWQCKDYADGWISFGTDAEAVEYQRETGCLLRIVYRPAPHNLEKVG